MKKIKKFFRYDNIGLVFVLPAFLYMMIFVGYPIVSNLILSLQDVTVKNLVNGERNFIFLQNYLDLFRDDVFRKALVNTLTFTVLCLLFQFIIGFGLAIFFNRRFKMARFVRGLLMMPWMVPITVTALVFRFIFATDIGVLNYLLSGIGLIGDNIEWLTTPETAMIALVSANIWIGIPFNMILLSAGLTTIPREMYESASIDGAGKVQAFFYITVPMLRATMEAVLILGFIYTFKVYDLVYVMTGGGPVNATHMLSTYSYKLSFELFDYSKGSAVANVLLAVLLVAGSFYLNITMKGEEANG